jgi:hypothetical protein
MRTVIGCAGMVKYLISLGAKPRKALFWVVQPRV